MEWIGTDELVEVTPKAVRLRKAILDLEQRKRALRFQQLAEQNLSAATAPPAV